MKLYKIQDETVKKMIEKGSLAIFNECGTGKTITTLFAMQCLGKKFLIVSPLSVVDWWIQEGGKLNQKIVKIYGSDKKDIINQFIQCDGFVTNYDTLRTIPLESWFKFIRNNNIKILVCDESTYFKHRNLRFRILKQMLMLFENRYILTGTPVTNSLLDLWSQMYVVDLGERLEPYYTRYVNKYFYCVNKKYFKYQPYPNAAEIINKRIQDIVVRYKLSDIETVEIPERIVYTYRYVEPNIEVVNTYMKLKREYYLKIQNSEVEVMNLGAMHTKLLEMSSGFVYDVKGEPIVIDNTKALTIKDILDNELYGKPVVVFYNFRQELKMLKCIPNSQYISSETSEKERNDIVKQFQDGKFNVLIAHCRTMGLGINLQNAYAIIWFSPTSSLEIFQQANSRVFRLGQQNKIVPVFLISTKHLIDYYTYEALENKANVQKAFMKYLEGKENEVHNM